MTPDTGRVEEMCEVMHDAYEAAAVGAGVRCEQHAS